MMYISTRGKAPHADFEQVLMAGLAPDGGLYVPEAWPVMGDAKLTPATEYALTAAEVMAPYLSGTIAPRELSALVEHAYAGFDAPKIAPLREIGDDIHLLELFHGPTLAFKDIAMQVMAPLMQKVLTRRGERTAIVGATSGDTGAAAVEAFRGREDIDLFILFPHGRVSDVQRRQMTGATEDNVHVAAIDGTFDDAQAIVKTLLNDAAFRQSHGLSAINSINWARIAAQAVYYFTACAQLPPGVQVSFSVPTGNFGDIFAGYCANRMGLPIERLVIATNENDILTRALADGQYRPATVHATDSPSMDIQVSSNFERVLFEESGRDGDFVNQAMSALQHKGGFDIPPAILEPLRAKFSAYRVSRIEAAAEMNRLYRERGLLVDPHTAIGVCAARAEQMRLRGNPVDARRAMVSLATAHPAKFPDAVRAATGVEPERPERLLRCFEGRERVTRLPNSVSAVCEFIRSRVPARNPRLH